MSIPGPSISPRNKSPVLAEMVRMTIEYNHVYDYLQFSRYPKDCSTNKKRALRRKAKEHFKIKSGVLMYSAISATKAHEEKTKEGF